MTVAVLSPPQAWASRSSSSHSTWASSTTSSSPGRCTTSFPPSPRSCPGPTATTPGTAPTAPTPTLATPATAQASTTASGPHLPPSTLSKWGSASRGSVTPRLLCQPLEGKAQSWHLWLPGGQPPAPAALPGRERTLSLSCAVFCPLGFLYGVLPNHTSRGLAKPLSRGCSAETGLGRPGLPHLPQRQFGVGDMAGPGHWGLQCRLRSGLGSALWVACPPSACRPRPTLQKTCLTQQTYLQVHQLPASHKMPFSSYKHACFFTVCSSVPTSSGLEGAEKDRASQEEHGWGVGIVLWDWTEWKARRTEREVP